MPAIVDGLTACGIDADILTTPIQHSLRHYRFALLYGPMQPMTQVIANIKRLDGVPPVVVWFTEQLPSRHVYPLLTRQLSLLRHHLGYYLARAIPYYHENRLQGLLHANRLRVLGEILELHRIGVLTKVAVFTESHRLYLEQLGLPAITVPMGYHKSFGQPLHLKRDIDVVFLGTLVDIRRRSIFAGLVKSLSDRNIRFEIRDGSAQRGYCFDAERTILLNRSKMMLNVMRQPWDDPIYRMLLAAPNGAMLVSESVDAAKLGPFRVGEHLAMAPVEDLADLIQYHLENDTTREKIAQNAFEFVTTQLTIEAVCKQLVDALDR